MCAQAGAAARSLVSIYGETEVTLVRTQLGLDSGSEPLVPVAKGGGWDVSNTFRSLTVSQHRNNFAHHFANGGGCWSEVITAVFRISQRILEYSLSKGRQ